MDSVPALEHHEVRFEETVDVVVVGLGVAGASAVVAARQIGADVLAGEGRGGPGGTAATLGGLISLGGTTPLQAACGFDAPREKRAPSPGGPLGPGVGAARLDAYC